MEEYAANNFACDHYTISKQIIDKVNNQLRKFVDNCDNVMDFAIGHSLCGCTGSGLGALILDCLVFGFRKKRKIGFEVYPSPNLSTCVVGPYNALLATHLLLDHAEICDFTVKLSYDFICFEKYHEELYCYKHICLNRKILRFNLC
ncbi:hypothetical protein RFI_32490 [Reticulomyxa filosa]|uniref:Tubulin/FtsZ GTPase domain-containing protein n=1 Tax=Reticulomyxa filosa TaxID=46433 RepID=X6LW46_RETFI|nr:hypothetical protein RFI_32490 [Reticulomyxa filosa]|eukprot:ETO04910.1 hypothetical protein RFI_32490 [Reticulomyxa filosa]